MHYNKQNSGPLLHIIQKMHVVEMRMLRRICGHTGCDRIRNEVTRDKVGVASMVDKMREAR